MAYIGQLLRNKWENFLFLFLWTTIYHFYPPILMHITNSANKGVKVNKMRKGYDLRMHILFYCMSFYSSPYLMSIFSKTKHITCWIKKISHQLFDLLLSFKHSSPVPKRKVLYKKFQWYVLLSKKKVFQRKFATYQYIVSFLSILANRSTVLLWSFLLVLPCPSFRSNSSLAGLPSKQFYSIFI